MRRPVGLEGPERTEEGMSSEKEQEAGRPLEALAFTLSDVGAVRGF